MLVKYESKSARVKSLSFHRQRPWLLVSLHSGEIQLWDYRIKSLLQKYTDHAGPVRAVNFHPTQSLFASGGDDYKLRIFNYQQKRCLFELLGHLDYIRTVEFHNELPWLVSASDDQTIRIWNYQNRSMLQIITGHGHYVMCARFHKAKDLIVSCSLDQTIRIWDFSLLRRRFETAGRHAEGMGVEVEMKQILEGHDHAVNWCEFAEDNLILSAGDDRKVKLWKYNDVKAWEQDSFFGHTHNVSCVMKHWKMNVIVSNSEDKSIRFWDRDKKICLNVFKKETDRFWILAQHPTQCLMAAGHDSGFVLFNLVRERIPYVLIGRHHVVFIKEKLLQLYNMQNKRSQVLHSLKYEEQALIYNIPREIQYNNFENTKHLFTILYDSQELTDYRFEIYQFTGNIERQEQTELQLKSHDIKQQHGHSPIFISRNKICYLSQDNRLTLMDIDGGKTQEIAQDQLPQSSTNAQINKLYQAPLGKCLFRRGTTLNLYDLVSKKLIGEISHVDIQNLKRVYWNQKFNYAALACNKKQIIIVNKSLQKICTINEKFNIKSLIWANDLSLFYNTVNHIKFSLINTDNGIAKCQEAQGYLLQANNDKFYFLEKTGQITANKMNLKEYYFKLALMKKDFSQIKSIINSGQLLGNSIIGYLYKKNYQGIAQNLVQNTRAKFSLAIDSGNLEEAYNSSLKLQKNECYKKLGEEALRQGNHQLVEIAYQNCKNIERLQFLYQITGNLDKLKKLQIYAQTKKDPQLRYQNAIILGDIKERVRILAEIGQLPLAYMIAVKHNLQDMARQLKPSIKDFLPNISLDFESDALIPPIPLVQNMELSPELNQNWPHNNIESEEILMTREGDSPIKEMNENQESANEDAFQVFENLGQNELQKNEQQNDNDIDVQGDQWGEDDIDLPDEIQQEEEKQTIILNQEISKNQSAIEINCRNSLFAGEQIALGNFEKAITLLKKQICAVNFEPFKEIFQNIYLNNISLLSHPMCPFSNQYEQQQSIVFCSKQQSIDENNYNQKKQYFRPFIYPTLDLLKQELQQAYQLTNSYKLQEALNKFHKILLMIPIMVLTKQEEEHLRTMMQILVEYRVALLCEVKKNEQKVIIFFDSLAIQDNVKRVMELVSYSAACKVQPQHQILFLKSAMNFSYKQQNFIYAAYFSRRILSLVESNPNLMKTDVLTKTQKLLQVCEQKGSNAISIEFSEQILNSALFIEKICASKLKLISKEENKIKCPFCNAIFDKKYKGEVCSICQVSQIGGESLGLKIQL